jgi:hypothetical protein
LTNTQQYGFQYGIDARPTSTGVFTVHTRIAAPFAGITPSGQQAIGAYIGTGDDDNYISVVVTANGGSPGVRVAREVNGATTSSVSALTLPGPDAVDLYLTVNPQQLTVQASYRVTRNSSSGPLKAVGAPVSVPSSWMTSATNGLAVGTVATSAGGSPFPATWTVLDVKAGTAT